MRDAIRQQLISTIPSIHGNVFEPFVAPMDTPCPYIVVEMKADKPWQMPGFIQTVDVWMFDEHLTQNSLDRLTILVANALGTSIMTGSDGESFNCIYRGQMGEDDYRGDIHRIARCVRFEIGSVINAIPLETYLHHPWEDALVAASLPFMLADGGSSWNGYPGHWETGYLRPAFVWRLTRTSGRSDIVNGCLLREERQMHGHVLTLTQNHNDIGINLLVQGVLTTPKILVDAVKNSWMTMVNGSLRVNHDADPLTIGQIDVSYYEYTRTVTPGDSSSLLSSVTMIGAIT